MDEQLKGLEDECACYRKFLESLKTDRLYRCDEKSLQSKIAALKVQ